MSNKKNINLDKTAAFQTLQNIKSKKIDLKKLLTPKRIKEYLIKNKPLNLSYATSSIDNIILSLLQDLADEQCVIEKYTALLSGKIANPGEKRKVLHHKTRSNKDRGLYGKEQKRIANFANQIHQGTILSSKNKPFDTVIQIGIGGSDLGPRAMYIALERYIKETKKKLPLKAHFIANIDPDDANNILSEINFTTTLFIVVSKSGTTQETLTNLEFVKQKAIKAGIKKEDISKHFIAVTGKNSPMDNPKEYLESFYIDNFIGGRYSSTSAVGGTMLSLAFGPEVFEEFLTGASQMDEAAKNPNIKENMSLMSALISIYERNILGLANKAIIPYSEALARFPAHLQQLDCESNGKSVNMNFEPISYQTGPVIFGEPGTNSQHSFFQKMHQGSDVVPIQFIGFKKAQTKFDIKCFDSTSQTKLNANLIAQVAALALGKDDKNANKTFSGNRSTSLVYAKQLTPKVLGALLAFYENTVMFQSFIWNINAFDQEGVQLGKILTKEVLSKSEKNPVLSNLLSLINKES
jgi:glucose-6-phosphate isomerase